MKRFATRAFLVALLLSSAATRADVLVGRNGERLSGHLVEEQNGRIIFISDAFGRLEIASDKASVELAIDQLDSSPPSSTASRGEEAAASVKAPTVEPPAELWSIDLGLKIDLDRGSLKTSEDRLDARLTSVRKTSRGELHGNVAYKYKATEGDVRDNDWRASLAYDRLLPRHRFNAGRVMLNRELGEEGYDSTGSISLATGWQFWEAPGRYLRIGPAIGYLGITRAEESFNGVVAGLYARGKTPLPGRSQLTGELQVLDTMGSGRYGTMALRVRRPLTEKIFISTGWNYIWSDFDIESGFSSEWRWDIGWRFGPASSTD